MSPPCSAGKGGAEGVVVASVRRRSPAAVAGLYAGDRIVAINGTPLRDAIDFQFYAADDRLRLTVERDDHARRVQVTRQGSDLGLELVPPRPRDIATCANKCIFCFIHQNPRGLRTSLYVKDDDFRLSFLHGNYITLSDLDEAALERIEAQRLSPLYISVHATDPSLRHALLGRPRHGAETCRGWNDSPEPGSGCTPRSCCAPTGTTAGTSSARSSISSDCIRT